jgi:hypothetical protein
MHGTGYAERRSPLPLALGIAIHAAFEALLKPTVGLRADEVQLDLEAAIKAGQDSWREERPEGSFPPTEPPEDELLALIEAMVRGWARVEAPRFFEEYEVVSVEREGVPQPLSSLVSLQYRADVVVRSRFTGNLVVINHKSSSGWGSWSDQWTTEIQSFSEAYALASETGEVVDGTVMNGLHKGALRQTQGKAHYASPLLFGYKQTYPDGTVLYHADSKAPGAPKVGEPKWEKFEAWREKFPGDVGFGIAAWIAWLPIHVVAASFMTSGVLRIPEKAVKAFVRAAGWEAVQDEHVLREGTHADKLAHFAPKFGRYSCGTFEKPSCAFFDFCWRDREIEELVEENILTPRRDHHATPPFPLDNPEVKE